MKGSLFGRWLLLLIVAMVWAQPAQAQDDRPETLDVFLDCERSCDFDYIRRTISYVNYVRDRVGSDVHVLVTSRSTGSGGRNYELQFIGLDTLEGMEDTVEWATQSTMTDAERREGLTEAIARGLVRFLLTTQVGDELLVTRHVHNTSELPELATEIVDPWNYWVFNIRLSGDYDAEESRSTIRTNTRVSADRVTEEWKIGLSGRFDYRESEFELSSGSVRSINRNGSVFGQVVKSLTDHWSAGFTTYSATSSSNNTDLSISVSPTVEFSFFPYAESSTRDFRARYEVNFRNYRYEELTVYEETQQTVVQNQFQLSANFRQPWGSARARFSVESYITDFEQSLFDLYNIGFSGEIDVRVARGLSVSFGGEISSVHDQIWLPLETSEDEDVLLGNRALPTSFEYEFGFGLSYRFGSIYNNVVNPRFGWGG